MKNTMENICTGLEQVEERISESEDFKIPKLKNKEKRMKKSEQRICNLWDIMKRNNLKMTGVTEEKGMGRNLV